MYYVCIGISDGWGKYSIEIILYCNRLFPTKTTTTEKITVCSTLFLSNTLCWFIFCSCVEIYFDLLIFWSIIFFFDRFFAPRFVSPCTWLQKKKRKNRTLRTDCRVFFSINQINTDRCTTLKKISDRLDWLYFALLLISMWKLRLNIFKKLEIYTRRVSEWKSDREIQYKERLKESTLSQILVILIYISFAVEPTKNMLLIKYDFLSVNILHWSSFRHKCVFFLFLDFFFLSQFFFHCIFTLHCTSP